MLITEKLKYKIPKNMRECGDAKREEIEMTMTFKRLNVYYNSVSWVSWKYYTKPSSSPSHHFYVMVFRWIFHVWLTRWIPSSPIQLTILTTNIHTFRIFILLKQFMSFLTFCRRLKIHTQTHKHKFRQISLYCCWFFTSFSQFLGKVYIRIYIMSHWC